MPAGPAPDPLEDLLPIIEADTMGPVESAPPPRAPAQSSALGTEPEAPQRLRDSEMEPETPQRLPRRDKSEERRRDRRDKSIERKSGFLYI